tara:strand:- start:569 stop:895 length:327 start_codon:yes stop_codon:yes gene_type:complete
MKTKVTEDTFKFVERASADLYSIKILKGRFKGVIYTYGKVSLNEDKESDQLGVNFQYAVEEGNRRYPKEMLNKNLKFKEFLSKILIYILNEEYGQYDEYPTTDIKENM